MTGQLALVQVPLVPALKGANQQAAWALITSTPGGVTADEIGALIHANRTDRWRHSVDERCNYCASTGLGVVRSKALARLIIRRRASGKYEPRDPAFRAVVDSVQMADLPGESFADIFGMDT